jgi:hypothetical protein
MCLLEVCNRSRSVIIGNFSNDHLQEGFRYLADQGADHLLMLPFVPIALNRRPLGLFFCFGHQHNRTYS